MTCQIRDARPEDAATLAVLNDMADEGLPRLFWKQLASPEETLWDVAAREMADPRSKTGWRNARVAADGPRVLGAMAAYSMGDPGAPALPELAPITALKRRITGQTYVDYVATFPEARGLGTGRELIEDACARARQAGSHLVGLIVLDHNAGARAFYRRLGFEEHAREQMSPVHWNVPATAALLMVKRL